MRIQTLLGILLLLNVPPFAAANNNPASGMYSPKLLEADQSEVCDTPQTGQISRFFATANCEYTCTGDGHKRTGSRELEWDPEKEAGMFKGDGALWATMTQRLSNKGKRTCLEAATAGCTSLNRIASVSYRGLQSGAWAMPAQILCGPGQPLTFSPYDPSVSSTLRRHATENTSGLQLIAELTSTGDIEKKAALPADCAKKISVSVCFGDCLCDPDELVECPNRGKSEQWAQVLGTRKPPASRTITLCADRLVAELTRNSMRRYAHDVLQYYCEDFAWRTIFARRPTGATCSAYRGAVDCSSLF